MKIPLCPGNPEDYVLVNAKEGPYWRRNRGTIKPAVLNETMTAHTGFIKQSSKMASRMVRALAPHTKNLALGRITVRFSAFLRKNLAAKGLADYAPFNGYDLQWKEYPFNELVKTDPDIKIQKQQVEIEIRTADNVIKKNTLIDGYTYAAILLYGDINSEKELKVASVKSQVYAPLKNEGTCRLSLKLPQAKTPWILFFRVEGLEIGEPAYNPRHHAMKVVAVSK